MSTFLPGVEANPQPGAYRDLIDEARSRGAEYSKIWDLFAFQHDITIHLGRFSQGILRGPSSISPGFRELIAAYTSFLNDCAFCTEAHVAAAAELLEGGEPFVRSVLHDLEEAPLTARERALLRFVARITTALPGIGGADVQALRDSGWDDDAIYFAITTCALFNFYNRWITATGVPVMSRDAHRAQGRSLATRGYTRA